MGIEKGADCGEFETLTMHSEPRKPTLDSLLTLALVTL